MTAVATAILDLPVLHARNNGSMLASADEKSAMSRSERHHARTMHGIRARIAAKLLALAAGVWLNQYLA